MLGRIGTHRTLPGVSSISVSLWTEWADVGQWEKGKLQGEGSQGGKEWRGGIGGKRGNGKARVGREHGKMDVWDDESRPETVKARKSRLKELVGPCGVVKAAS